jgi:hypothetical protein
MLAIRILTMLQTLGAAVVAAPLAGPVIPAVSLDLTGCWEMGASNGRSPPTGCGTATPDSGDGLV